MSDTEETLHVIPQLWFRNTWSFNAKENLVHVAKPKVCDVIQPLYSQSNISCSQQLAQVDVPPNAPSHDATFTPLTHFAALVTDLRLSLVISCLSPTAHFLTCHFVLLTNIFAAPTVQRTKQRCNAQNNGAKMCR
jgi:hypothetical protein